MIAQTVLESIGDTPLIRLSKLSLPNSAEIWVKWEGANPTGSMKDRGALGIIEGAERRGQLSPGGRVVEYTGGTTGSSLAMVCAAKGYKCHFVSSDAFAEEKLQTMRAFGATVEVVPSARGKITKELIQAMIVRAEALAKEPKTFYVDQFNNRDKVIAYHAMAEECLRDLDGKVDAFVMCAGTGAAFSGNAEIFKERARNARCVTVEPATHRNLSGGPLGGHRIEGIGVGFIPKIMRMDLVDQIVAVSDSDAFETARRLAGEEGIFGGTSSGANVYAALKVAKDLGLGRRVVTVIVDSGLKYVSGDLFR